MTTFLLLLVLALGAPAWAFCPTSRPGCPGWEPPGSRQYRAYAPPQGSIANPWVFQGPGGQERRVWAINPDPWAQPGSPANPYWVDDD